MVTRLIQLLEFFVPPSRRDGTEEHQRSLLVISMLLIIIVSMPINIVQQAKSDEHALLAISVSTLVVYLVALFAYRRFPVHKPVALLLLIWGLVGILGTCLLSGGLYSSVTPFLCILPIVALALVGRGMAIYWSGISLSCIGGLALVEQVWAPDFGDPATHMQPLPWSVNLMIMLGYGVGISWFVDQIARLRGERLEEARARADDANAAKSAFLANMSHELRTPMNGVLGMTQVLLGDPELAPRHREQLETVHASGQALVGLLNDILDLSKVEAGQLVIEDIPWDPTALVHQVQRLYADSAAAGGLHLRTEVEGPGVPRAVLGDPTRVRQVLCNLVGNAIKFTPEGGVVLGVQAEGSVLHFWVEDTGPGIAADQQHHLFQPFTQADASTARRHGGTGLGLAICRRLTALMGGELVLESEVGAGCAFHLRLPLRAASASPAVPRADPEQLDGSVLEGCAVLLVEDMPVNQVVARAMLSALGCTVEVVADGLAARDLLISGRAWDVVLMDWHLPGMDGVDVSREARACGYSGPIIGLSASVREEDRRRMLDAGVDAFLGKPYTRDQLARAIALQLHRSRRSA